MISISKISEINDGLISVWEMKKLSQLTSIRFLCEDGRLTRLISQANEESP